MHTTEVGDYTPIPTGAEQDATEAARTETAPEQGLPSATVSEVPNQQADRVVYRYVVRPATDLWHIWEETTDTRITLHPLRSRGDAEDAAAIYNRLGTPPR